jgi:hypothetical protein
VRGKVVEREAYTPHPLRYQIFLDAKYANADKEQGCNLLAAFEKSIDFNRESAYKIDEI